MEQNKQEILDFWLNDSLPLIRGHISGKFLLSPKTGNLRKDVYITLISACNTSVVSLLLSWYPNLIDIILIKLGYQKAPESPRTNEITTGGTPMPPTDMPDMNINIPNI